MRIEIEIPKEFESNYDADKFVDFFERVFYDIGKGVVCGNYEKETADMFIKAFAESKPAYDVEKVVEELDDYTMWRKLLIYNLTPRDVGIIEKAIEIVRNGGKE